TQELANQLEEASSGLRNIQKEIEASVSDSLRLHSAEALQSFEHSMEELAQESVDGWRVAFAGGLNSLVKILGEQFVLQAANGDALAQVGPKDKPSNGARR